MDNIKTWKNTAKRMIDFLPVTWICCFYSAHSNPAGCLRFFWWFCCNLCIDSVVLYTYPVISTLTQLGLAGNQQQLRTTSTSSARCKVIPIACWAFLWRTPLSRSRRNGWRTLPRATKIGWHGEQKTLKVVKFIYIYITQKKLNRFIISNTWLKVAKLFIAAIDLKRQGLWMFMVSYPQEIKPGWAQVLRFAFNFATVS